MSTAKLVMPELSESQASKAITHNEALAILDQLVQARVVDKDLATPPGSPANGAAYIVASSPTGAWTGNTNKIAYWLTATGVWQFLTPAAGWEVWVTDESTKYRYNGSAWVVATTAFTGGTLTSALNEAPMVTLASASTVNIGAAAANTLSISGTTTITAFDSIAAGAVRRLVFQGALTLTHNATSLILPAGANITTAAGDVAEFVSLGSGNWRCFNYQRASGVAVDDIRVAGGTILGDVKVQTGGLGIVIGADTSATTLTDSTSKIGRMALPHYTNAEEPTAIFLASNTSTSAPVFFGGGTSLFNAATAVQFYTASNNTTTVGTLRFRIAPSGTLEPGADNTQTFGSGALRWSEIFAGNGTINTSDAREKTDVAAFTASEIDAAKALSKEIGIFQFLDSVAAKGSEARRHIGMTVQRAIEIMEGHGLDPFSYGFICYDEWDETSEEVDETGTVISEFRPAGNRYGFRQDQLLLFIARGFEARLSALESA